MNAVYHVSSLKQALGLWARHYVEALSLPTFTTTLAEWPDAATNHTRSYTIRATVKGRVITINRVMLYVRVIDKAPPRGSKE